jgi:hypothetical protein
MTYTRNLIFGDINILKKYGIARNPERYERSIDIFINQMAGRKLLLFRRIRKNHQR